MAKTTTPNKPASDAPDHAHELEEYQGGEIQARHGYIPVWLLAVYAVLLVWSLYYGFVYWGFLGQGRI